MVLVTVTRAYNLFRRARFNWNAFARFLTSSSALCRLILSSSETGSPLNFFFKLFKFSSTPLFPCPGGGLGISQIPNMSRIDFCFKRKVCKQSKAPLFCNKKWVEICTQQLVSLAPDQTYLGIQYIKSAEGK
jgi:hypothetical protein